MSKYSFLVFGILAWLLISFSISAQDPKATPQKEKPKKVEKEVQKGVKGAKPEVKDEKKSDPKVDAPKEAPPPPPELTPQQQAEKTLQDAKVSLQTDAIIKYIEKRTISLDRRNELAKLIDQLGSESFEERQMASDELVDAGISAIPYLRKAGKSEDPEVVYRANACMKKIDQSKESEVFLASIRLLAFQKSPQTVKILLDYLPCSVEETDIQETIFESLVEYSKLTNKADPTLQSLLGSEDPKLRILAIRVFGNSLPTERPAIKKLVADPNIEVRFWAGMTLVQAGDKSPITTLLSCFTEGPIENAYEVETLFCQLAGPEMDLKYTLEGNPESRKKCQVFWEDWWKKNEAKTDLAALNKEDVFKGITIIAEVDNFNNNGGGKQRANGKGRVWACGRDGKMRWEWLNVDGPVDIQRLPNGHLLIAEYYSAIVTERDAKGKIVWQSPRAQGSTTSACRLPNGNTIVAALGGNIVEISRDGKQVGEPYPIKGGSTFQVRRGKNGHIYILGAGEIVEYDYKRKQLHEVKVLQTGGWGGFDILPNGNFLVSSYTVGKNVFEIDRNGKTIRVLENQLNPTRVQRLPNGNDLVAGGNVNKIVEFDRNKKEVWKVETQGRPFAVLRY